jgi:hypothetical protein
VSDEAGNFAECHSTVIVKDTSKPELVCPQRLFEEATGPEGARVYFPVVARDAVSVPPALTYSHSPGTLFPLDQDVPVTIMAMDGSGNASSCQFRVHVRDTVPPKLTCPDVVHVATSAEPVSITYEPKMEDAVSTPELLSLEPPSGSKFELGETKVVLQAKDQAGNVSECRFFVYNVDPVAPAITCPEPQHAVAPGPEGAVVSFPEAEATDEFGEPAVSYSHEPGSTFPVGETTVTATASDPGGNRTSCSFTVTVEERSGCGCGAGTASASVSWLLLALVPLWARRRAGRRAG